jgi:hypothetical protein
MYTMAIMSLTMLGSRLRGIVSEWHECRLNLPYVTRSADDHGVLLSSSPIICHADCTLCNNFVKETCPCVFSRDHRYCVECFSYCGGCRDGIVIVKDNKRSTRDEFVYLVW